MTFNELVERIRDLGFVCEAHDFGSDGSRAVVAKLTSTPGNRLAGQETSFEIEADGGPRCYAVDWPCPSIWLRGGVFEFTVVAAVPTSSGAYHKLLDTAEEVYEELLHYFFDADSRMSLEQGFVAGPGRPATL